MSQQTWQEVGVPPLPAVGTLFNTYTAAKTILPAGQLVDIPRNWWTLGRIMRVTLWGAESHRVTGPDTMTFQLMMGSGVIFSSGAVNLTTTAHTTIPFKAECMVTCQIVGAAAQVKGQWKIEGQGFATAASLADNAAGTGQAFGPNTAPALGPAFDATVGVALDVWVAQSFSGAGNGIQIHQYLAEFVN